MFLEDGGKAVPQFDDQGEKMDDPGLLGDARETRAIENEDGALILIPLQNLPFQGGVPLAVHPAFPEEFFKPFFFTV
jgi:hypothetical protein